MIAYDIDPKAHLVTCEVTSRLRLLDAGRFMAQLFADPAFDATDNILVAVDEETVTPDISARNNLADLLLSWRELQAPAKVALVLPGSAWGRIATQLIADYGLSGRNVCCFADKSSAMLWFQEKALASAA